MSELTEAFQPASILSLPWCDSQSTDLYKPSLRRCCCWAHLRPPFSVKVIGVKSALATSKLWRWHCACHLADDGSRQMTNRLLAKGLLDGPPTVPISAARSQGSRSPGGRPARNWEGV